MADLVQRDIQVPNANMPDFTGASRGIDTNKAFEKLFAGIGDAIEYGTKSKDLEIRTNIRKDAQAGFDVTQNESISAAGGSPAGEPPSGLMDGKDTIERMKTAYDQGLISDTHYYGRLTSQLKSLRTKYPGYEDVVDSIVQEVTGTRPANAYRSALMEAINTEAKNEQETAGKWDTYIKQNEEFLVQLYPDYFQNPDKYDQMEIRSNIAKLKAEDQMMQSENLRMTNASQRDNLTEEEAAEHITNLYTQEVSRGIEVMNRTLGIDKFTQSVIDGNPPSPEEHAQIVMSVKQYKMQLRQKMMQNASKPINDGSPDNLYTMGGGTKAVNEIIDQSLAQFDLIEEYLGAKDYNMATYHAKLIEARANQDLNTVLGSSEAIRLGSAISKIDQGLGEAFFRDPTKGGNAAIENLIPEILSGVVLGTDNLGAAANRVGNARGQTSTDKARAVQGLLEGTINGITSGKGSPAQRKQLIVGAYDPASSEALFKLVKPEEYQKLYAKMYNPEVTKAIMASGDKEAIEIYAASAMDRIGAIPEIRRLAGDMQEGIEYAKYIDVGYDEKTNRIIVKMKPPTGPQGPASGAGLLATWQNNKMIKKMTEGKDALNTVFATLGPIIEATGGDETEAVKAVIKNLAIDMNADKKTSILWSLYEKVSDKTVIDDQKKTLEGAKKGAMEGLQKNADEYIDYLGGKSEGVEIGSTITGKVGELGGNFLNKVTDTLQGNNDFGDAIKDFQSGYKKGPETIKADDGTPLTSVDIRKGVENSSKQGKEAMRGDAKNAVKVLRETIKTEGDSPKGQEAAAALRKILAKQPDIGDVKGMAPLNFAGGGVTKTRGLDGINTSNKRGYTPDVEHLNSNMKTGIVQLQKMWGEPVKVISGYRGKARNARAGGAKKSQHIHGNAVDIDASEWSRAKRIKFIQAARAAGFNGIGVYPNAIHIDKGKRRAWGPNYSHTSIPKWARPYL